MICTSDSQKVEILRKIDSGEFQNDEKVLTFLLVYLLDKATSETRLDILRLFTGKPVRTAPDDIWFEAQPISPRHGVSGESEGNTHVDMAMGGIALRYGTDTGIRYDPKIDWVCFVEAKLYSDCSSDTTYDPFRNQLTRVIENLVTFQSDRENHPKNLYFTLLTPRMFRENPFSKLYGYKYYDYMVKDNIKGDFEMSVVNERDDTTFKYPDKKTLNALIKRLKLNWVSYEEIFELLLGIRFCSLDIRDNLFTELEPAFEELKAYLEPKP